MGTAVGSESYGIGVAPGANWIACKGLNDQGSGSNANLIACGQFMLCPHTYNGGSPNCVLAPHVVSNSWGGGAGNTWYDSTISAWKAANIVAVFAIGGSGPSCRTASSPGDSEAGVICATATTSTDAITSFSARGPSNSNTQKPDISAPGNVIVSAGIASNTALMTMSGSSMAVPHVAGVVALLKSQTPNATFETIKRIIESTADRNLLSTGQVCNSIPDTDYPNYTFGYGRINALKAVLAH